MISSFAPIQDYTPQLQQHMQLAGFSTFRQLCDAAQISEKQLRRLRRGQIRQLRLANLHSIAQVLALPIGQLLTMFDPESEPALSRSADPTPPDAGQGSSSVAAIDSAFSSELSSEYQRLQEQLQHQRDRLWQEFQQTCLQTLEPWLLQWSAAAYAAQQNPQLPALRLLPLLRPIEQLLQAWGVVATESVGSEIPYDPQQHQLMEGTAAPGDLVRVRYAGYRQTGPQPDRLLYRPKVSPARSMAL
jgi:DNA-binding Xre family transcriptional regulator